MAVVSIFPSKYTYNPGIIKMTGGDDGWYPKEVFELPEVPVCFNEVRKEVKGKVFPALKEVVVKTIEDIVNAIKSSKDNTVEIKLGADISSAEDKSYYTLVDGIKLIVDLAGHTLETYAIAFGLKNHAYLEINDTLNTGVIKSHTHNTTAVITLAEGSTAVMNAGMIDTRTPDDKNGHNYSYGVSCVDDSLFKMNGGIIHTDEASCISISNKKFTNKFAGDGNFIIGGDSQLITDGCAAVYQASTGYVVIKDNAKISGGIAARMGHFIIKGNAEVANNGSYVPYPLGKWITESGVEPIENGYAFIGLCGIYTTDDGENPLTLTVKDNAKLINSEGKEEVAILKIDTGYDQKVDVDLHAGIKCKVYEYDELVQMNKDAGGKALKAKNTNTDATIKIAGKVVYPVKEEETTPTEEKVEG